ncbi:DNA/RNA nuclease SfsA [Roseicitreum antarcticum]|nr:DNA/RNA nuclease SfsA [Roseicitreum antarcticum]
MQFQTPLIPARLIRRYKRFLADFTLADGQAVTAHCPNTGAMTGLDTPGLTCWLEPNTDPRKKLAYGWRLVGLPGGGLANIDTSLPNRIVAEGLAQGRVATLSAYTDFRREVVLGASRVDFRATAPGLPDVYLEVKSVTLRRGAQALFPDTVTTRGARHLADLAQARGAGHRAVMLYLISRTDCAGFGIAADLDPAYASAYDAARRAGVEVLAHACDITLQGITFGAPIPTPPL